MKIFSVNMMLVMSVSPSHTSHHHLTLVENKHTKTTGAEEDDFYDFCGLREFWNTEIFLQASALKMIKFICCKEVI